MLNTYKLSQTSIVLRVVLRDSSVTTGAGLTGLAYNSSGLKIATIADNEATTTAYTVAGSTIETISTLGTFATPTSTKCRFKEVDSTNHPGLYEIQLDNTRYAVSSAKSLVITISGATNLAQTNVLIPLTQLDPYSSTVSINLSQAVSTSNTAETVGDALNAARANGFGKWAVDTAASPPTLKLYANDGTTVVRTFNLDSATAPTTRT